jgi:hypothetical protein
MPEEELVKERWVFKYRYYDKKDHKIHGVWRNHHGNEASFSIVPSHASAGSVWLVETTPDGTRAAIKNVRFVGAGSGELGGVTAAEKRAWHLTDRAAVIEQRRVNAAKKLAAQRDLGNLTLYEVATEIRTARSDMRVAMIAAVINYLGW